MLSNRDSIATVAVRDIDRAAEFYEAILGLTRLHNEGGEAFTYRSGQCSLLVYRSELAGTNQATAVTWTVGAELDSCIAELSGRGVEFEHYQMPAMRLEGHVHVWQRVHAVVNQF